MNAQHDADEPFGLPARLDWSTDADGDDWEQLSQYYRQSTGQPNLDGLGFMPLMFGLRPNAVKRYRLAIDAGRRQRGQLPDAARALNSLLDHLLTGYAKGILYDLRGSRERGASKAEIGHVLTLAWMLGGNHGVHVAADVAGAEIAAWPDAASRPLLTWPQGWAPDQGAWSCGIDWTRSAAPDELTADDLSQIKAWHLKVEGQVPDYVDFLAAYNPIALKTYRARFENSMHGPLPRQFVSLLVLTTVTQQDAMLRALSTAKSFGVAREYVISALTRPRTIASGLATRTAVDLQAVASVLESWER